MADSNPVLVDPPGRFYVLPADSNSNPAAAPGLGAGAPRPLPGVVQTTIDTRTTTLDPRTTITNQVEPR